ncbi:MAG TPA: lytic murein transglycosylase [Rhizomicrobium sp.]|nr:lytic murein transglycosylase [Rhizomicrobium sp.]
MLLTLLRNIHWRAIARASLLTPVLLSACTTGAPGAAKATHVAEAPVPAPLPDEDAKFYAFVKDFRQTAIDHGISAEVYDRSMAGISRNARVEELNLAQPEFIKPVWEYLDTAVSPLRVANGQQEMIDHDKMLEKLKVRYGVPREILVAIWGMESNYGQSMGNFNMFEALATLAYDGPRQEYARRELLAALKMEQEQHLDPKKMLSSWAGAFGNTQFVPSSFLDHAVDGDGDGRIDLWTSPADALASTAALMNKAEWHAGEPCEYEIRLPKDFAYADADSANFKPMEDWRKVGVRTALGAALPQGPGEGAIYLPAGSRGPAFMVLHNFNVVLKYNNAASYALGVCYLAGQIVGDAPIIAAWPRSEQPMTRDERMAFQTDLKTLGYDPGAIDGVLGHQVRAALRAYQSARGLAADGYPTKALLKRMDREIAGKK